MVIIEYNPDLLHGHALGDGECEKELAEILEYARGGIDLFKWYSTENIFTLVRLAIVEDNTLVDKIRFKYGDQYLTINKYGAIPDWPKGFCDYNIRLSVKIMTASMAKVKEERNARN